MIHHSPRLPLGDPAVTISCGATQVFTASAQLRCPLARIPGSPVTGVHCHLREDFVPSSELNSASGWVSHLRSKLATGGVFGPRRRLDGRKVVIGRVSCPWWWGSVAAVARACPEGRAPALLVWPIRMGAEQKPRPEFRPAGMPDGCWPRRHPTAGTGPLQVQSSSQPRTRPMKMPGRMIRRRLAHWGQRPSE